MASERLIMGTATAAFAVLAVVLWADYLSHSDEVYGDRDAASAQLKVIDAQLATAQDADQLAQLSNDRAGIETLYSRAVGKINDMDGWAAPEWKVKNALRLASPAIAALFGAFTLLAVLNPLK